MNRSLMVLAAGGLLSAEAPKTRTDNVAEVLHGVKIVDPYRWLEDQDSPETRKWIDAQMAYTRSVLDASPRRKEIVKRLDEMMRPESLGQVNYRRGRYYYMRRTPEQNQGVLMMREGMKAEPVVLIDPNQWGG